MSIEPYPGQDLKINKHTFRGFDEVTEKDLAIADNLFPNGGIVTPKDLGR